MTRRADIQAPDADEPSRYCEVEGCTRPAKPGGGSMCYAHYKRQARGAPLSEPVREHLSPRDRLREAALAYADVDAEDDAAFARADKRLLAAAAGLSGGELTQDEERMLTDGQHRIEHLRRIAQLGVQSRLAHLSPAKRRKIAKQAARARWTRRKP